MQPTQYMDLTQDAATAPEQQQPTRFRPSNYTVDLNNSTNPPPPQVMVKPAVMLRREERPQPVSFSVTAAPNSPGHCPKWAPEVESHSELAAILLSSGRRDQALDISTEVLSIAEGVHQVLFIPWNGTERATFGMQEEETGSHYEYVWAHGTSPAGLQGILSEDVVRPTSKWKARNCRKPRQCMAAAAHLDPGRITVCRRSSHRQSSDRKHTAMEWRYAAPSLRNIITINATSGTPARSTPSSPGGG